MTRTSEGHHLTSIFFRAIIIVAALSTPLTLNAAAPATFNVPPRDFFQELRTVVVGDFNHDGILDIAGAVGRYDYIKVYIGKGDGSFSPPVSYGAAGTDYQIGLADIDGDGNLDIVATNSQQGGISFLLGTGTGTFGPPTTIPIPGNPYFFATGDFNGDGKPDIAVVDSGATIVLLLSSPSGFLPLQALPIGGSPDMVHVADFNNDGKLDLSVLDGVTGDVLILFGNGDGTFRTGPSTHVAFKPVSFAALDLNGDGFADIIAPNNDMQGALIVLLGNGDGTFQPPAKFPTSNYPDYLALGDFNGDGNLDVIVTSTKITFAGGVSVLFGDGAGKFGQPHFSVAPFGAGPVVVGDFNGDGRLDALVADAFYTSLLRGEGNGYFVAPPHFDLPRTAVSVATASADFNGDGKPDLITATTVGGNSLWISLGNGDSTFQPAAEIPLTGTPYALVIADVNNDGKPDIVLTIDPGAPSVGILLGNGDGTFQNVIYVISEPTGLYGLTAGDFNHDGKVDIAFSTMTAFTVLPANGDGTFGAPITTPIPETITVATAGDFNRDGNLDIVGASTKPNSNTPVLELLLGNGDGTFHAPRMISQGGYAGSIITADFNADGILDFAVANNAYDYQGDQTGSISVHIGNGDGTFQPQRSYAAGDSPMSIQSADLNGDGFPDLATANLLDNNMFILLGNGDGTFTPALGSQGVGYQPQSLAIADFNGDGKPDIAVGNQGSVSILTNTTAAP